MGTGPAGRRVARPGLRLAVASYLPSRGHTGCARGPLVSSRPGGRGATGGATSGPTDRRSVGPRVLSDAEADVVSPEGSTAICVQRFDDSRNSAIHTTYRISLRSSSLREPRYPLLRVVSVVAAGGACRHTCFRSVTLVWGKKNPRLGEGRGGGAAPRREGAPDAQDAAQIRARGAGSLRVV
jgi:hypothetical protein